MLIQENETVENIQPVTNQTTGSMASKAKPSTSSSSSKQTVLKVNPQKKNFVQSKLSFKPTPKINPSSQQTSTPQIPREVLGKFEIIVPTQEDKTSHSTKTGRKLCDDLDAEVFSTSESLPESCFFKDKADIISHGEADYRSFIEYAKSLDVETAEEKDFSISYRNFLVDELPVIAQIVDFFQSFNGMLDFDIDDLYFDSLYTSLLNVDINSLFLLKMYHSLLSIPQSSQFNAVDMVYTRLFKNGESDLSTIFKNIEFNQIPGYVHLKALIFLINQLNDSPQFQIQYMILRDDLRDQRNQQLKRSSKRKDQKNIIETLQKQSTCLEFAILSTNNKLLQPAEGEIDIIATEKLQTELALKNIEYSKLVKEIGEKKKDMEEEMEEFGDCKGQIDDLVQMLAVQKSWEWELLGHDRDGRNFLWVELENGFKPSYTSNTATKTEKSDWGDEFENPVFGILVEEIQTEFIDAEEELSLSSPPNIPTTKTPSDHVSSPIDEDETKTPKRKYPEMINYSLWTYYDSRTMVIRLLRALNDRGVREKELKTKIAEKLKDIGFTVSFAIKKAKRTTTATTEVSECSEAWWIDWVRQGFPTNYQSHVDKIVDTAFTKFDLEMKQLGVSFLNNTESFVYQTIAQKQVVRKFDELNKLLSFSDLIIDTSDDFEHINVAQTAKDLGVWAGAVDDITTNQNEMKLLEIEPSLNSIKTISRLYLWLDRAKTIAKKRFQFVKKASRPHRKEKNQKPANDAKVVMKKREQSESGDDELGATTNLRSKRTKVEEDSIGIAERRTRSSAKRGLRNRKSGPMVVKNVTERQRRVMGRLQRASSESNTGEEDEEEEEMEETRQKRGGKKMVESEEESENEIVAKRKGKKIMERKMESEESEEESDIVDKNKRKGKKILLSSDGDDMDSVASEDKDEDMKSEDEVVMPVIRAQPKRVSKTRSSK